MLDWIITGQKELKLYKADFINTAGAPHSNESGAHSACHSGGAFLKIGQPLTWAVLGSNRICCAGRLAEKCQCEGQARENAGSPTVAVTVCDIMD